ncbi:hypothetical protein FGB62_98g053 [Gracilaria domingensis]|nr:hypothetical protein FGB62_98g053 [Gracilaria domingensis]
MVSRPARLRHAAPNIFHDARLSERASGVEGEIRCERGSVYRKELRDGLSSWRLLHGEQLSLTIPNAEFHVARASVSSRGLFLSECKSAGAHRHSVWPCQKV